MGKQTAVVMCMVVLSMVLATSIPTVYADNDTMMDTNASVNRGVIDLNETVTVTLSAEVNETIVSARAYYVLPDSVTYEGQASIEPSRIENNTLEWVIDNSTTSWSVSFDVKPLEPGNQSLNVVPDSQVTYVIVSSGDVEGKINLNPNNSPHNNFSLTVQNGSAITRANLTKDFGGYAGNATYVHVKPKGSGSQNNLTINGVNYTLSNANTYGISAESMTVNLYNDHVNKKGKAMGKWWIAINATNATITMSGSVPFPGVFVEVKTPPVAKFRWTPEEPYADQAAAFDASDSYDPDGGNVSYHWDFGDGYSASNETVTHAFDYNGTYTVTLTVTDDEGETASVNTIVNVLRTPPVAKFSVTTAEPYYIGQRITFNASASYDDFGHIVSYNWNFGDGVSKIVTSEIVTHRFNNGNYTVSLAVIDDEGESAIAMKDIEVQANRPPIARFTVSNATPATNQSVTFDATASYDPDGHIAVYRWDFEGDGTLDITGNVVMISHSYSKTGDYTVKLEVEDDYGEINATTRTVTVNETGTGEGISGNASWDGKHIFNGLGGAKSIGIPRTITATAKEIKNNSDSPVNVTVKMCVDGTLLNSTTETLKPKPQNPTDITVTATWVPMSSGKHYISLHAHDGRPDWAGPTNDPMAEVRVFITKVG